MTTQGFLRDVLPSDQNAYFLMIPSGKVWEDGKEGKWHRSCKSPKAMAAKVQGRKSKDTWFAIAGFAAPYIQGDDGRKRYRVKENVSAVKALVLDLDVDPKKPGLARTKDEAMASLKQFLKKTGFFKPTYIVDSGGGYHVYWCFTKNVEPADWYATAAKFKRVLAQHGGPVAGDLTRVADLAGVLRVPGTSNCKKDKPRKVRIVYPAREGTPIIYKFKKVRKWLEGKAPAEDRDQLRFGSALKLPPIPDEVRARVRSFPAGITVDTYVPDFVSIQAGCQLLTRIVTEQEEVREPLWYAALGLLCTLDEDTADDMAQEWSKEHPDYTQRGTSRKLLQVREQQGDNPTTCTTLADRAISQGWDDPCAGCPLSRKVRTPYRITPELIREKGTPDQVEQVKDRESDRPDEEVDTPEEIIGFQASEDDGIYAYLPSPTDGKVFFYQKITEAYVDVVNAIEDSQSGNIWAYRVKLVHQGRTRTKDVEAKHFVEAKQLKAAMSELGVVCTTVDDNMNHLVRYLGRCRSRAAKHSKITGATRFGMYKDSFLLGTRELRVGGVEDKAVLADDLEELGNNFWTAGTLGGWLEAAEPFLSHKQFTEGAFMVALSAGTPLMVHLGMGGTVVNIKGPTGAGKSISLMLAHSVWGTPIDQVATHKDTEKFFMRVVAAYYNLPVCYDEVTNIEAETLRDLTFSITSGTERGTLQQDRRMRKRLRGWNLFALCTSNTSVIDKIRDTDPTKAGEIMRVLEFRLPNRQVPPAVGEKIIRPMVRGIKRNHGVLAQPLAELYMSRATHLKDTVIKRWDHWTDTLGNEHRYRAAAMACAEVGGTLLRHLGVEAMSKNRIAQMMKTAQAAVDFEGEEAKVGSLKFIADLFSALWPYTRQVISGQESGYPDRISAVYEWGGLDHVRFKVSVSAFTDFCARRRLDPKKMAKSLQGQGLMAAKTENVLMERSSSFRVACYDIDYSVIDNQPPTVGSLPEKSDD